jgi:hypothetical protein
VSGHLVCEPSCEEALGRPLVLFLLDKKGSCLSSIHIEKNHLQPKAYEFSTKQKLTAIRQRFCQSLELTPLSLKPRYRTQGSGKATQRITTRKHILPLLQHNMDGSALIRMSLQKSKRRPPSMLGSGRRGAPGRHPLEVLAS